MVVNSFRSKRILELAALGVIAATIIAADAASFVLPPEDPLANAPAFRATIELDIRLKDASAARQAFLARIAALPDGKRHLAAHLFGEALFNVKGAEGIGTCEYEFGFGCFHGFFTQAVSREGADVISVLDAGCTERFASMPTGCQHGIGHGILEFTGHDSLSQALELCTSETEEHVPLLGCKSGVFMEFFSPLVKEGTTARAVRREYDSSRPYAPCSELDAKFGDSCYYEFAAWALEAPGAPRDPCAALSGSARSHCYLGTGAHVGFKAYDVEVVRRECAMFTKEDEFYCRAGGAWAMYSEPGHDFKAPRVCEYADSAETSRCLQRADLNRKPHP